MRYKQLRDTLVAVAAALFVCALAVSGCQRNAHPDDKQAVYNTMNQNQLGSVEVFQDRNSGVMTLRGIVASADQKSRAEALAGQAAPGYSIRNQLQVESTGLEGMEKQASATAALDSAIEDQFKAKIRADRKLEKQSIQFSANNGTLYLKGSVKTDREKQQAEDLARQVPQVQHVVNDIEVKPS